MKTFQTPLLFLLALITFLSGCKTESDTSVNPQSRQLKKLPPCGNDNFPEYENGPSADNSYQECSMNDPHEIVSADIIANKWTAVNLNKHEDLGFRGCGVSDEDIASLNVTKTSSGNNPKLIWDFKYSHFFIIERKVDSNPWSQIYSIPNWSVTGETHGSITNYIDTEFHISSFYSGSIVKYRVKNKNFNALSSATEFSYNYIPGEPGNPPD